MTVKHFFNEVSSIFSSCSLSPFLFSFSFIFTLCATIVDNFRLSSTFGTSNISKKKKKKEKEFLLWAVFPMSNGYLLYIYIFQVALVSFRHQCIRQCSQLFFPTCDCFDVVGNVLVQYRIQKGALCNGKMKANEKYILCLNSTETIYLRY